jgi:hypothetical protein
VDGQAGRETSKLTVAFHNFAESRKNCRVVLCCTHGYQWRPKDCSADKQRSLMGPLVHVRYCPLLDNSHKKVWFSNKSSLFKSRFDIIKCRFDVINMPASLRHNIYNVYNVYNADTQHYCRLQRLYFWKILIRTLARKPHKF